MLTPLDDTLRHVLPTTFDHAGTSDPRFFDRYWFAVYDPAGTEPAISPVPRRLRSGRLTETPRADMR